MNRRKPLHERLEPRQVLAALSFSPNVILERAHAEAIGAGSVFPADLDGDGDEDLLVGSRKHGRVV